MGPQVNKVKETFRCQMIETVFFFESYDLLKKTFESPLSKAERGLNFANINSTLVTDLHAKII